MCGKQQNKLLYKPQRLREAQTLKVGVQIIAVMEVKERLSAGCRLCKITADQNLLPGMSALVRANRSHGTLIAASSTETITPALARNDA